MIRNSLINKLSTVEVELFIERNKSISPLEIILRFSNSDLPIKEIAEQIECINKAQRKIPTLSKNKLIYKKTSLEQASSELTALYKSKIVSGKRIIDLTGGLGIDSIYFSTVFDEVIYCEVNTELAEIAEHNFKILGINNIKVINGNGIEILKKFENNYFDWIYADPSRREGSRRSVDIKYYSPDVVSNLELFFDKSANICIKLAPAFDIKEAERIFPNLNEFSVVSVKNECKEVLLFFKKADNRKIKSAVILYEENKFSVFGNKFEKDYETFKQFPEERMYFFEPDAAIRKAGLTKYIAEFYQLNYINPLSDYLISKNDISDFPGRKFKILFVDYYSDKKAKQYLSKEKVTKANIASSNFPYKPEAIKEKLKLKDGGDNYLFFTKDNSGKTIFLSTVK